MTEQPQSPPPNRRRSSIVELFNPRPNLNTSSSSSPTSTMSTSPTAPQHRRGLSITNMGLTTNNNGQSSPYNAFARQRRASVATSNGSGSPEFRNSLGDEPAVVEEDDGQKSPPPNTSGSFARRVSFGAQAMRDVAGGSGSPGAGEGFNWSEALRDRTKRSPSFSASANPFAPNNKNGRTISSNALEPPKEMPKPAEPVPQKLRKPDHLGERMLRGDFMMD